MMLFCRNRAEVIARQASETTAKPEADLTFHVLNHAGYNTRLQIGLGKSGVLFVVRDVMWTLNILEILQKQNGIKRRAGC